MKVLWISNIIFPDIAQHIGVEKSNAGGWMYGLASSLIKMNLELHVATVTDSNVLQVNHKINGVNYHILPTKEGLLKYDKAIEPIWKELTNIVKPDIIHIHGTEYPHGLALMNACPNENYVISLQGLISVCARYYLGGISIFDIFKNITFRDLIRRDSIFQAKKKFFKRGHFERLYIEKAKNVIGRTEWDYAHCKAINSSVRYHFCNETLRSSFYENLKWDINKKQRHTIFLSQAYYPLKGLHKVIEAVNLIKEKYPNLNVRIAGGNILETTTFRDKLSFGGYGKYVKSLLKKNGLVDNFEFLGVLNESQMLSEYLRAHVFICPSSIENSSNSLGEAQILGTPCIASYVGGNSNMISHRTDGLLYRFEEVEMLAQYISELFNDEKICIKISKGAIETAELRHNKEINKDRTFEIYNQIYNDN